MTKPSEWLASTDPAWMLSQMPKASDRKLRLYVHAIAVKRHHSSERIFETNRELESDAEESLADTWAGVASIWTEEDSLWIRQNEPWRCCAQSYKADLIREIFGNPSRMRECRGMSPYSHHVVCQFCHGSLEEPNPIAIAPEWRTSNVVGLARQMYDSGDFSAMPIMGDALMDAGCQDSEILAHCRGGAPCTCQSSGEHCQRCLTGDPGHVRGCWLIDLILEQT
jgi:hypothetical protein